MSLTNAFMIKNKTVIGAGSGGGSSTAEFIDITYEDWLALSDEEREAHNYTISNFPGVSGGGVKVDLVTKLWENPDPTAEFVQQDIELSSDDYDFLLVVFNYSTTAQTFFTILTMKGKSGVVEYIETSVSPNLIYQRSFMYASDTEYLFTHAGVNGRFVVDNDKLMIPVAVYGFKSTINLKVDAFAKDVSTSASKCMLEDGRSVEEAITGNTLGIAIVWENENPYTEQSAQDVTMIFPDGKTYEDVDYYEVMFNIVGRSTSTSCMNGYTIGNNGIAHGERIGTYDPTTSTRLAYIARDVAFNGNIASIRDGVEGQQGKVMEIRNISLPVYRIIAHFK